MYSMSSAFDVEDVVLNVEDEGLVLDLEDEVHDVVEDEVFDVEDDRPRRRGPQRH